MAEDEVVLYADCLGFRPDKMFHYEYEYQCPYCGVLGRGRWMSRRAIGGEMHTMCGNPACQRDINGIYGGGMVRGVKLKDPLTKTPF